MRVYLIFITVGTRVKLETNSGEGSIFHEIEIAEKLRGDETNFVFLSDCVSLSNLKTNIFSLLSILIQSFFFLRSNTKLFILSF